MSVEVDEAAWPVVVLKFTGENGPAEMKASIRFYRRMFVRGKPFSVIVDTRASRSPGRPEMKTFSSFCDENKDDFANLCAGVAFVISGNIMIRMTMRTIFQIAPPPFPATLSKSFEEAQAWCEERLQRHAARDTRASG